MTEKLARSCGRTSFRGGLTVTEILIAASLLSLVMVMAWQLFGAASRSAAQTEWLSRSQSQLRNSLTRLRTDISQASYPSEIGPTSVTISRANRGFRYRRGTLDLAANTEVVPLIDFYICKPKKTGFGADENSPGEELHAQVFAEGDTVKYRRSGSGDEKRNLEYALFNQGDYIRIEGPVSAPDTQSSTCLIEMKKVHPVWEMTGVTKQTIVKIDVQVSSDL